MMSQRHKNILIKNRVKLVRGVKVSETLLSCLMEDYTLTTDMKEEIEAKHVSSDKVGTLLDTLMRRDDTAFKRFVFALVETNQDGMARVLDETIAKEFIAARDADRQASSHSSNPGSPAPTSVPMPSHSYLELQQRFAMMMSAAAGAAAASANAAAAANQMGNAVSSASGSVVSQPNDGKEKFRENEDTVDSKLEEERALAIINGRTAMEKMTFTVRLATNLDLVKHPQVYRMDRGLSRGRVLIINNHYFIDSKLTARHGAANDGINLRQLFEQLSFTVEIHDNQCSEEMKTLFEKERTHPDHEKASMFILFILSHGNQGNVFGLDGKELSIENDITSCFTPEKAPLLAGKPKIFFIQACQGNLEGMHYRYASDSDETEARSEKDEAMFKQMEALKIEDKKGFIPGYFKNSDTVMSYATVKGYLSWRSTNLGSWFVRCLVHVFSERAHSDHLLDMLTEVNSLLSKLKTNVGVGQLAEKSDTLTKKLYFFPGTDPRKVCSVSE